jgi:hypothetical protein
MAVLELADRRSRYGRLTSQGRLADAAEFTT